MTPSGAGWTETTLHVFNQPADYTPNDDLTIDASGAVIGSSSYAGVDGVGQIFRISQSPAVSYSVIHEFTGSVTTLGDAGGGVPYSSVVADANGVLYGTTFGGGSGASRNGVAGGAAYSLTPPIAPATGWSLNVLYDFSYYAESFPKAGPVIVKRSASLQVAPPFAGEEAAEW